MLTRTPIEGREARLRYLQGTFQLLSPGEYVVCATTGARIALADLKYWDVDSQQAYADADAADIAYVQRHAYSQSLQARSKSDAVSAPSPFEGKGRGGGPVG